MNKHDFTALVKNPNQIGAIETEKLREVVQAYPYFAVARNLLVKSLHNTSHYEYDSALKMAALLCGNRAVLYNLVHDLPLNSDVVGKEQDAVETLDLSEGKANIASQNAEPEIIPPAIPEPAPLVQPEIKREELVELPKVEAPVTEAPVLGLTQTSLETSLQEEIEEEPRPRFTTDILEEEKLVKPEGRFKKFIPNRPAKENSSQSMIPDKEEEVLSDFDISSLDSVGKWQVVKPTIVPEETPLPSVENGEAETAPRPSSGTEEIERERERETEGEATPQPSSVTTEEQTNELVETEVRIKEPETPAEIENTPAEEEDFLTWLRKKEAKKEEVKEEEKIAALAQEEHTAPQVVIEEDVAFVEAFTQSLASASHEALAAEIEGHVSDEVAEEVSAEVEPMAEVPAKEFEFNFDFLPKKEVIVEPEKEADLLESLANYEIDIFMAPVYKGATFEVQIFEEQFKQVFQGEANGNLSEEDEIFLIEESLPKIEVDYSKADFIPFTEIRDVQTDNYPILAPPPVAPPPPPPPVQAENYPSLPPPHPTKNTVESILDKFIRENPTIARPKSEFYSPINMAKQSVEADDELVSETLANIYLRQGLHKKAIGMYEKLGLLYPDKLAYFAGLIEKVKSENNLN